MHLALCHVAARSLSVQMLDTLREMQMSSDVSAKLNLASQCLSTNYSMSVPLSQSHFAIFPPTSILAMPSLTNIVLSSYFISSAFHQTFLMLLLQQWVITIGKCQIQILPLCKREEIYRHSSNIESKSLVFSEFLHIVNFW